MMPSLCAKLATHINRINFFFLILFLILALALKNDLILSTNVLKETLNLLIIQLSNLGAVVIVTDVIKRIIKSRQEILFTALKISCF